MRLVVRSLAILMLAGCSKGEVKAPSSPTQASQSTPQVEKVKTYRVNITGVYLGCKPSQDAARQALAKLPGVSDVTLDAKAKTIQMRVTEEELKKSLVPIEAARGNIGALRALADVGLAGDIDFIDQPGEPTFKVVGPAIVDGGDPPKPKDRFCCTKSLPAARRASRPFVWPWLRTRLALSVTS